MLQWISPGSKLFSLGMKFTESMSNKSFRLPFHPYCIWPKPVNFGAHLYLWVPEHIILAPWNALIIFFSSRPFPSFKAHIKSSIAYTTFPCENCFGPS